MMNKVFSRGTGAGKGPVDYCVNTTVPAFDPETRRRIPGEYVTRKPAPIVLSGDPARTKALIDSIDNKWRYTSGVIAFGNEDAPTPDEINDVIRSFESMAFTGLDPEQFDCLWVMHRHEGNVELHYVTPRVELTSGKALNIAPPGYLQMFDAWRDSWNFEKGWSRPDDPGRAKLVQVGDHLEKTDAARLKAGLEKSGPTKAKQEITDWLVERIKSGYVKDRAGVLASLAEIGTITKSGDTFISVQPDGFTKAFRLKGGIYGESFKSEELESNISFEESGRCERGGQRDSARAEEARRRLAEAIKRRADYNSTIYHPNRGARNAERRRAALAADRADPPELEPAAEPDAGADFPRDSEDAQGREREAGTDASSTRPAAAAAQREGHASTHDAASGADQPADQATGRSLGSAEGRQPGAGLNDSPIMGEAGSDQPGSLAVYLSASLGPDSLFSKPGAGQSSADPAAREGAAAAPGEDLGDRIAGGSDGPVFNTSSRSETRNWLEIWQQAGRETWQKLKGLYDRARAAFNEWVRETSEAIRSGHEAAAGAELAIAGASIAIAESNQQLVAASRAIDQVAPGQRDAVTPGLKQDVQQFERTAHATCGVLKMNRDDELQRFKTDIDLIQYCAGCGYEIDKSESSRTSTIMRRGGAKIGVAVDVDGHWVYSDLRNDGRGGSIIDFVQDTQGLNLGQVRKELRGAAGHIAQIPIAQRPRKPEPSSHSRQAVQYAYLKTRPTGGRHDYLNRERGIDPDTLQDPRFSVMVKVDPRGNAIFPHFDDMGLSGYEIRGQDFKGFSKHGEKTLWHSANLDEAREVIFVEGAINALSHAQLYPNAEAAYVSIGGQMSETQRQLVARVMRDAASQGAVIVLATDGDNAGEAHAQALKALAPAGAHIERDRPVPGLDWNDQAKQQLEQHQQAQHRR